MRIRAAATAPLLALALLSACSDDDEPATTDADAQAAIDAAQLEAEDLGEGYTLTSTTPPGDDASDEENPLDDCMETDLDDRFDDATVAETDERTFTREGTGPVPTTVSASNVALSDASLFDEMHELLRSEEFGTCVGTAFEELFAQAAADAEVTLGELVVEEDVVDPDAADDLESTSLDIPITASSQGLTVEAAVTMAFLDTGDLGSSILVFGATDEQRDEQLAEWGRLVAERLADA